MSSFAAGLTAWIGQTLWITVRVHRGQEKGCPSLYLYPNFGWDFQGAARIVTAIGDVTNERDVELKYVEPLLRDLGCSEQDWVRQLPVRMDRNAPSNRN
jgi:hypothetical protein